MAMVSTMKRGWERHGHLSLLDSGMIGSVEAGGLLDVDKGAGLQDINALESKFSRGTVNCRAEGVAGSLLPFISASPTQSTH